MLRIFCDNDIRSWSKHVTAVEICLNSTPNTTGLSPFDLAYIHHSGVWPRLQGADPTSQEEALLLGRMKADEAQEALSLAKQRQAQQYNKRHLPAPAYAKGDKVWVHLRDRPIRTNNRQLNKLRPVKRGPYVINDILSKVAVSVQTETGVSTFTVDQLEPYVARTQTPATDETDEGAASDGAASSRASNRDSGPESDNNTDHVSPGSDGEVFSDDVDLDNEKIAHILRKLDDGCIEVQLERGHRLAVISEADLRRHADKSKIDKWIATGEARRSARGLQRPRCQWDPKFHSMTEQKPKPESVQEKPVLYLSRQTRGHEQGYHITELELAGLTWAVTRLRMYLEGAEVVVITDHKPLIPILKSSTDLLFQPRVDKFRMMLQPYSLKVVHRSGRMHGNADGLSRLPTSYPHKLHPDQIFRGKDGMDMEDIDPVLLKSPS